MNNKKLFNLAAALSFLCILQVSSAAAQTTSPEIIWERDAHPGGASAVEFSPDGARVASGGAVSVLTGGGPTLYAQAKTWTANNGTLLSETPQTFQRGGINEISFSPDGARLAAAIGAVYCAPQGGCGATAPGVNIYNSTSLGELEYTPTFPINATIVDHIDVIRRGKVRRAKLYYLRDLRGKAARIAERDTRNKDAARAAKAKQ